MIAVLTWKLHNYGTALQAFALVKFISNKNKEYGGCKLLNYSLPDRKQLVQVEKMKFYDYVLKFSHRFSVFKKNVKNKKYEIYYAKDLSEKKQKFNDIYNLIPHDQHRVNVSEKTYFNNVYEKIIVGSDQVWNPKYFCETYFLNFVDDNKKFSYAPSLGVSFLTLEEEKFLRKKLYGHFQKISIRETIGGNLLRKILPGQKITYTIDPTLLFSGTQWSEMFNLKSEQDEKYILVYTLADNSWYKKAISLIVNKTKINKVIYLTQDDNLYFYHNENNFIVNAGPIDFLNLLKNAQFVITDSFHGVCFSINFEKQFVCFSRFKENNRKHENSRVVDLLNQFNICEMVYFETPKVLINHLDYSQINKKLNALRKKSEEYITEIIMEKGN